MSSFDLPLRVDIVSGERLEPTGIDPYSLPWVQGAASTIPLCVRRRYPEQIADLREKLSVLRSKRAKDTDIPAYGPRRRERLFYTLPEDGGLAGGRSG